MKPIFYFLSLILFQATVGYSQDNNKMGNKIITTDVYAPTKSEKAKDYYQKGTDAVDAKDFKKAIAYLKSAIAADPEFIDAYDNLGIAFRQVNELDSAERYYLISRKKYPKGIISCTNLAIVEEKRKNYDKAISYYKEVVVIDAKNPEAYYGLMRQYIMLQKFAEAAQNGTLAEKYYKEANSPYIGDCYYMEMMVYIMADNKLLAQKYMALAQKEGMTIDPKISDALK